MKIIPGNIPLEENCGIFSTYNPVRGGTCGMRVKVGCGVVGSEAGGGWALIPLRILYPILASLIEKPNDPPFSFMI